MGSLTNYKFQFKIDYLERIVVDQINHLNQISHHVNNYDEKLQSRVCQFDYLSCQLRNIQKCNENKGAEFEVEHLNLILNQKLALKTAMQNTLNLIDFYRKKKISLVKTQNRQRELIASTFKTIKKFESHKDSLLTQVQCELLRNQRNIDAESQLICHLMEKDNEN